MIYARQMLCCGLKEIGNLTYYQSFDDTMRELKEQLLPANYKRLTCGALMFTEATKRVKYGKSFASAIKERDFGKVTVIDSFRNPNTRHAILTYIWILDQKKVLAYLQTLQRPISPF